MGGGRCCKTALSALYLFTLGLVTGILSTPKGLYLDGTFPRGAGMSRRTRGLQRPLPTSTLLVTAHRTVHHVGDSGRTRSCSKQIDYVAHTMVVEAMTHPSEKQSSQQTLRSIDKTSPRRESRSSHYDYTI